jgi:hypothetical protein
VKREREMKGTDSGRLDLTLKNWFLSPERAFIVLGVFKRYVNMKELNQKMEFSLGGSGGRGGSVAAESLGWSLDTFNTNLVHWIAFCDFLEPVLCLLLLGALLKVWAAVPL